MLSAKYAASSVILFGREKTPVEVYIEVKTAYGDKAINCKSGVANLKTVVRLCKMIRGAEALQ